MATAIISDETNKGVTIVNEDFLIGTYTSKTSKGMYAVTLNHDQKKLENVRLVVASQKPAYLQQVNNRVYAVKQDGNLGGIASYQLSTDGVVSLIDQQLGAGAPPAYVGYDQTRQLVYSANYHKGTVTVFKLDQEGHLTKTDEVTHQGECGPKPEQDAPHAHYADLTPDKRLAVCDLGMDLVVIYDVSDEGKLTQASRYQAEAGFGPRHLVFHPNGQVAYVLGELSSKLEVLKYDERTGSFSHLQTIDTIPADWNAHNGAAAIHVSSDGRFVYSSNRGENTIAVFKVEDDLTLRHTQSITTAGDFPRDFELSQDEAFLVASNQNSDNLTLYSRDATTGQLTLLQQDVACPEPVCVKQWVK
jgi:6-phosphogluconolactonase